MGSTICRESHAGVHINAGPEIGVASTKAYTSQVLCLIMFALVMAEDRISLQPRRSEIIQGLKQLPDLIKKVLELDEKVKEISEELYQKKSLLIMGRGFNFATCLEGALKVKELTYMHSGLYILSTRSHYQHHFLLYRGYPGWGTEARTPGFG